MKQLKFMIAAAAAIGLAGVAQAAFPSETEKDAPGNTGFEEFDAETAVTTGTSEPNVSDSYFWYTGDVAADNESKIVTGVATLEQGVEKSLRAKGAKFEPAANVLQVNTGTDPLLRTINRVTTNEGVSSAKPVTVPETGIYIDTLVQFTVTPAGDTVEPGEDDKLMIYLQEVADDADTTEVNEAATNLVVVAGYTEDGETVIRDAYKVAGTFEAGQWYRLTVRSFDGIYSGDLASTVIPAFTISIDGNLCSYDKVAFRGETAIGLIAENAKESVTEFVESALVLSLKQTATLKAVGFAGEGLVDDIVFSTTLDVLTTAIDFTFTWSEGITGVTYVIGNDTDNGGTAVNGTPFKVEPGKQITVTVATADWYKYTGESVFTAGNVAQTNALEATKLVNDVDGAIVVAEGTTATDLGITGTFAAQGTTTADLQGALNWAMKVIGKTATSDVTALVSGLTFDAKGNAASTDADAKALEEAYLLNCAVADIETKKAAFKFAAFTPGELPAISGEGYNGTVVVEGKGALGDAEWAEATEDNKGNLNFFRARLKK